MLGSHNQRLELELLRLNHTVFVTFPEDKPHGQKKRNKVSNPKGYLRNRFSYFQKIGFIIQNDKDFLTICLILVVLVDDNVLSDSHRLLRDQYQTVHVVFRLTNQTG